VRNALEHCVIFITCPNLEEGRGLARGLVEEKLAACVNVVHNLESIYWWQGKIESSAEVLLIVKTSQSKWEALQHWVKSHHSYTVPEIIALPILEGNLAYLAWIGESVS